MPNHKREILNQFFAKQKFAAMLVLVCLFLIVVLFKDDSKPSDAPSRTTVEEQTFWWEEIKEKGGQQAHMEFFETYRHLSDSDKHVLLHLFGEGLYDVYGNEGIRFCDTRVAYACYHGFMSKPASEGGLEAIAFFGQECYRIFGDSDPGCKHGLGHILLEYLGDDQLVQALEICRTFPVYLPLGGCAGGVFMEYHTFDIRKIENPILSIRRFDPADPYDPCPRLSEEFLPACYFALPKWWNSVFIGDFVKIDKLCEGIREPELQNVCWEGAGWMATQAAQHKLADTLDICKKMKSADGRSYCQIGVAWTISSLPETRDLVPAICADIEDSLKNKCFNGYKK